MSGVDCFFFFQAEDGIRDVAVTGVQTCALPIYANLKGANVGDHKDFDVEYPADYPDEKLAGKKFHYAVEILGIKTKKLPELNDDFAKDVSEAKTLEELKTKDRKSTRLNSSHGYISYAVFC